MHTALLLVLVTCSTACGPAHGPAPDPRAAAAERLLHLPSVEPGAFAPAQPRDELPMIGRPKEPPLALPVELPLPGRPAPMPARAFFTADGRLLGVESTQTIDDPRRLQRADAERGLQNAHQRIVGEAPVDDPAVLDALWKAVGARIDLSTVREFHLNAVQYGFDDGSVRPALVLYVWGPENPLAMPDELPEVLKDRIRFVYDVSTGELSADNLL